MFNKLSIDAGIIPVGIQYVFSFNYNGTGELISIGSFGCACTTPEYNKKTKVLTAAYTPKAVPQSIVSRKENKYRFTGESVVSFLEDGIVKKYVLRIMATPYDRNLKFT